MVAVYQGHKRLATTTDATAIEFSYDVDGKPVKIVRRFNGQLQDDDLQYAIELNRLMAERGVC